MDNQNLQNLTKIAKIFQPQNIITSEEIDQVLKGIMEILATYKKGTESINEETKQVVNKLLDDVVAIHKETLDAVEEKKNTFADDFVNKITELQKAVSSIQEEMNKEDEVPEEEDNSEEEKQALVEEVLSQIKLPEYKETIVTGEDIVDKINELPLTDENKIDFSRIKNAPSIKGKNLLSPTVLSNAVDLDTSARADGYSIVWDDTNKRFKFAAGSSISIGTSITSATAGSVLFAGTSGVLAQDNSNLFWDDTNNRLGLGTATPSATLHVAGQGGTAGMLVGSASIGAGYVGIGLTGVLGNTTYNIAGGTGDTNLYINRPTGGSIFFRENNGTSRVTFAASGLNGFETTAPTHTLTLGSTSTGIALYNTSDQTTNYERGRLFWSSNILTLSTELGGTGTARALQLIAVGSGSNSTLTLTRASLPTMAYTWGSTATTTGSYVTFSGTNTASSGSINAFAITPTINQSSTAGYTALLINPTETTTGSGTKALISIQVGSAEKFGVLNTGITTITNSVDAASNQILNLKGSRATPATSDEIYQSFTLNNGSGTAVEVARFIARETTITAGSESAELRWTVRASGTLSSNPQLFMNSVRLSPFTNDGMALGASGTSWSDLFLASGAVINFNNGNATLTHSAGLLTSNVSLSIGTSNVFTTGTIEIGAASDTTISRSSAGVIAVEGVPVVNTTTTQTVTNKFVTPQVQSVADAGGTLTPVSITNDVVIATALSQATTIAAPTGSPVQGEKLVIRLKDNGTARALTWNAIYRAIGVTLPTTTVISKTVYCGFIYNSTDTKWDCVAVAQES